MHVHVHASECIYTCTCTCMYVHAHTHVHVHVLYIHVYTLACGTYTSTCMYSVSECAWVCPLTHMYMGTLLRCFSSGWVCIHNMCVFAIYIRLQIWSAVEPRRPSRLPPTPGPRRWTLPPPLVRSATAPRAPWEGWDLERRARPPDHLARWG